MTLSTRDGQELNLSWGGLWYDFLPHPFPLCEDPFNDDRFLKKPVLVHIEFSLSPRRKPPPPSFPSIVSRKRKKKGGGESHSHTSKREGGGWNSVFVKSPSRSLSHCFVFYLCDTNLFSPRDSIPSIKFGLFVLINLSVVAVQSRMKLLPRFPLTEFSPLRIQLRCS